MKPQEEIINQLRESLDIQSISQIPELQDIGSYIELKDKYKKREIVFGFKFQDSIINNFGSTGEIALDKILLFSPILIILLSILFAYTESQYYFLFGVPITLLAFLLTTPSIMKQGSSILGISSLILLVFGIQYYFNDSLVGFLILSYSIPNLLITVNRKLNMQVFQRAILTSEIIFIYYFLRGECYIKSLKNKKLYTRKT